MVTLDSALCYYIAVSVVGLCEILITKIETEVRSKGEACNKGRWLDKDDWHRNRDPVSRLKVYINYLNMAIRT